MHFRIQSDESLHSYIDRNIVMNWKEPSAEFFKALSKSVLRFSEIKKIALAMGWLGCRGFNRLLHFNTDYYQCSVFKNSQNFSYSQDAYISQKVWKGTKRGVFQYCPDCVREDISLIGFSFWHRSHHAKTSVCAKHNVILEKYCPFCRKPFTVNGHGLEIMWNGCEGRSLAESLAVSNHDPIEFKWAKLLSDVYSFGYHVSEETTLKILYEKLSSVDPQCFPPSLNADITINMVKSTFSLMNKQNYKTHSEVSMAGLCLHGIMLSYGSFDDFINEIKLIGQVLRPVDSLLATYKTGGWDCFEYVTDDLV